jgi:hypothetical protein
MKIRYFALVFGIYHLAFGVLGFIPALNPLPADAPPMAVDASYGYLFSLFPTNIVHNILKLALGVWGIIAYRSLEGSVSFSRGNAIILAVIAIFGLIPGLNTIFGILPLHSHDIWLHAAGAAIAAYFGWAASARTVTTPESGALR